MRLRPKTRRARALRLAVPTSPKASRFRIPRMRALFPEYDRAQPERLTTEGLLRLAKMKAVMIIKERAPVAEAAFRSYAARVYRVKPQQVTFDDRCVRRIRNACLSMTLDADLCGETELDDEGQIWISGIQPMSFARLVGTLVHESLHGWCRVRGKCMPIEREHACMKRLGDFSAEDGSTTVSIRNATKGSATVSYYDLESGRSRIIDTIRPRCKSDVVGPPGSVLFVCSAAEAADTAARPQLLQKIVVEECEKQEVVITMNQSPEQSLQSRPASPGSYSVA